MNLLNDVIKLKRHLIQLSKKMYNVETETRLTEWYCCTSLNHIERDIIELKRRLDKLEGKE